MDLLFSFIGLAIPIALGMLAGGLRLFGDPDAAIGTLNRYALYIAFPALIVSGLTRGAFTLPTDLGFWLIVPLAMLLTAGIANLVGRVPGLHERAGTLAMVGVFGNVAYVGLPLCERLLGESILGLASLSVSLFVVFSLLLGPTLLLAWSAGSETARSPMGAVLRQPLLWSPVLGLLLRWTPWMDTAHALLAPVGHSAAPVALFLLGLYLYVHRAAALTPGLAGLVHVAMRLLVFPIVLTGLVTVALQQGLLQREAAQVFVLLSATPTAIATFALAVEFEQGAEDVAQSIVLSTMVSAVTLPIVGIWVLSL